MVEGDCYYRVDFAGFHVFLFEDLFVVEVDADGYIGERGVGIYDELGAEGGPFGAEVVGELGVRVAADAVVEGGVFFADGEVVGDGAINDGGEIFGEERFVDVGGGRERGEPGDGAVELFDGGDLGEVDGVGGFVREGDGELVACEGEVGDRDGFVCGEAEAEPCSALAAAGFRRAPRWRKRIWASMESQERVGVASPDWMTTVVGVIWLMMPWTVATAVGEGGRGRRCGAGRDRFGMRRGRGDSQQGIDRESDLAEDRVGPLDGVAVEGGGLAGEVIAAAEGE